MSTIPVTEVVNVTPGVITAGGAAPSLLGLVLTTNTRVPIGTVASFSSVAAVSSFFGGGSQEVQNATNYFAGFDNSNKKPSSMLFAQYPLAAVAAYLRGGNISALTLTQLQALNGTLSVTIDTVVKSGTVNLSGATSFTNAAEIIAETLDIKGSTAATFTGSISGTTLTVASGLTGTVGPAQIIAGSGVTADTTILSQITGTTGGIGTYLVDKSQTAGSTTITATAPAVNYDSVSGAFVVNSATTGVNSTITFGSGALATSLLLTSVTGAVLSPGAAAGVPATFMNALTQVNRGFASWMLNFNPDNSGNDIRFAFAQWNGTQNSRFCYEAIDDDLSPTTTVPATACLAQRIANASIGGVSVNWQTPASALVNPTAAINYGSLAAFACGYGASIDFTQPGGQTTGRVTSKFRQQSGLVPTVTDQTTFDNLAANGYNTYGAYADGGPQFTWYANGVVSGPFLWLDTYLNQIAINGSFRSALVALLQGAFSIPYNAVGRATISAALQGPINTYLNFGAFRAGVTLSPTQISAVNASAGKNIADTLTNQGWYLLIGDAAPSVRQSRGSPPITFYYVDGESVQQINMASIVLL